MTLSTRFVEGLILGLWLTASVAVAADEPKKARSDDTTTELETGKPATAATIDRIMDQAVHNIAARYKLNEKQTDITRKLMKDEVYKFLKEHEAMVWPVIGDLLKTQLGVRPPDSEEDIKRIGKSARPLAALAKEAIFAANERWRAILTDEQIRVHDFDMNEMESTFAKMDENLQHWQEGDASTNIVPTANLDKQPPPPTGPPGPIRKTLFDPIPILETLVEQFIKDYGLTEGQITAAQSILEEFKNQAIDYRDSKKNEFSKLAAEQQAALDNRDLDGAQKARAEEKKLLLPILELGDQMEVRLMSLLDSAQRSRHAEAQGKPKEPAEKSGASKVAKPSKSEPEKKPDASGSESH